MSIAYIALTNPEISDPSAMPLAIEAQQSELRAKRALKTMKAVNRLSDWPTNLRKPVQSIHHYGFQARVTA
jgi:hypothetical protein